MRKTVTFRVLLNYQSDENLIDIYNETLQAIEDQKKYHDSQMVLEHFNTRKETIEEVMKERGLK